MAHAKKDKTEERKYVQMAPETVQLLAEASGMDQLAPNVATALSEDATYRTRELAHICSQFMRHGRRSRLTAEDVDRALRWYDEKPLFGHGCSDRGSGFAFCESAEVFVPAEGEVDLLDLAAGGKRARHENDDGADDTRPEPDPAVRASWLSLEGSFVHEDDGFSVEFPKSSNLSAPLMQYYNTTTSALLGESEELIKAVFDDVSSNPKISALLPFYVSFVRAGIQRQQQQQQQHHQQQLQQQQQHAHVSPVLMRRLLFFLQALFANPHLNFSPKPYLSHLVTALLSGLIPDRSGSSGGSGGCTGGRDVPQQNGDVDDVSNASPTSSEPNHWPSLRQLESSLDLARLAATVLRGVLDRWATPVNQLRSQTYRALVECLRDRSISHPTSQHGAVVALTALGPEVVDEHLLPILGACAEALAAREKKVEEEEEKATTPTAAWVTAVALNHLRGAMSGAARAVLCWRSVTGGGRRRTKRRRREAEEANLAAAYEQMSGHFGDALCTCPLPELFRGRSLRNIPERETVGKLKIRRLPSSGSSPHSLQPPYRQMAAAAGGDGGDGDAAAANGSGSVRPATAPAAVPATVSSSSSSPDFDDLAHRGVPSEIFEPMDVDGEGENKKASPAPSSTQPRCRPDLLTPRKISPGISAVFETGGKPTTVRTCGDIRLCYGDPVPRERLRRRTFLLPANPASRTETRTRSTSASTVVVVGRRMDYPMTTERFRTARLFSCIVEATI